MTNSRAVAWRLANPQRVKATDRQYHERHRERRNEQTRIWRATNREKQRALQARWRAANPDSAAAHCSKRRTAKLLRLPVWADVAKIKSIYEQARIVTEMLGEPWHVDHISPLQGKLISGLHVHTNLQILPWLENLAKSNSYAE